MKNLIKVLLSVVALYAIALRAEVPADAVWIDVRSSAEFASGHLEGAHHIPWDSIETGVAALKLDRDRPIYLYCAAGGRAEQARQRLAAQGYTAVTNAGGLEQARQLALDQ